MPNGDERSIPKTTNQGGLLVRFPLTPALYTERWKRRQGKGKAKFDFDFDRPKTVG